MQNNISDDEWENLLNILQTHNPKITFKVTADENSSAVFVT